MKAELVFVGNNGIVLDLFRNEYFTLTDVEGMTRFNAEISSAASPNMDGDTINSVKATPRSLVLNLRINQGVDIEQAKRLILSAVKPKQKGRLRLTRGGRTTEIEGIVEGIEMPRFQNGVSMQIPLYCSEPYWRDAQYILFTISRIVGLHYFEEAFPVAGIPLGMYEVTMTRSYTNDGDASCGMIITIIATGTVTNPRIIKADGSFIGVNDTMQAGESIIINTSRGEKSITKGGVSIFSKIQQGSKFIQLDTGVNVLTIDSDDDTEGNMYFNVEFKRRFV